MDFDETTKTKEEILHAASIRGPEGSSEEACKSMEEMILRYPIYEYHIGETKDIHHSLLFIDSF